MVGLAYLSTVIGVAVSCCFNGIFSDWLTIKLARRNKGIQESEQRLWPFLACLVIVPASLILWGVGAAHHVSYTLCHL